MPSGQCVDRVLSSKLEAVAAWYENFIERSNFKMGRIRSEPSCACFNYSVDRSSKASFCRTFPNDSASPPCGRKRLSGSGVHLPIARYLGAPEFLSRRRPFEEMAVVSMPEAAVRE